MINNFNSFNSKQPAYSFYFKGINSLSNAIKASKIN